MSLVRSTAGVVITMVASVFGGCDSFSPGQPLEVLPAGVVTGAVVAADGGRTPRVELTLSQGTATVSAATDAGGIFTFPAVTTGAWSLSLGELPSNWVLSAGQAPTRSVIVREGITVREEFVVERVPS